MFGQKQKSIEEQIKELDPKVLARGLMRTEADFADKNRYLYRKGAKSMLQNFVKDPDFVEAVMNEFDYIYAAEDTDEEVQRIYKEHMKSWAEWGEGDPIDHWIDDNGYLCIRYRSGEWWHYEGTEPGEELSWW